MSVSRNRKVLVAGGGIAGLAFANCLERLGMEYKVLEQAPCFGDVGFGITMGYNAMRTLEKINPDLEKRVFQAGAADTTWTFTDDDGSLLLQPPEPYTEARGKYGTAQFVPIKRTRLQEELLVDVKEKNVVFDAVVKSYEEDTDGVSVQLEDGRSFEADILVGADGIHSHVRRCLHEKHESELGPEPELAYGAMSLFGGQVQNVPVPLFGGQKSFYWTLLKSGALFICLPMPGDVQYWSLGWPRNQPIHKTPEELALTHKELRDYLLSRMDGVTNMDWQTELINQTDDFIKWDLFELLRAKQFKRWGHGRVTLMGDSAHAITPWVGQGGSISIEDAFDLASRLRDEEDWVAALADYEHLRMPRARAMREFAVQNFSSMTQHHTHMGQRLLNKTLWSLMRSSMLSHYLMSPILDYNKPPEPLLS